MSHVQVKGLKADETILTALVPVWDSGEETLVLPVSGDFVFGSSHDCAVRISLPGVADHHCRVICRETETVVEPFGKHDVWVNDVTVMGAARLERGDTIAIGPATFRVERRRESRFCRVNVSRPAAVPPAPPRVRKSVTAQVNQSTAQQSQPADAVTPPSMAALTAHASHTPVLEEAGNENRRRLLDARETQLTEWQSSLERRCVELDARSTTLARQHSALLERQTDVDRRTAELEAWHDSASQAFAVKGDAAESARRDAESLRADLAAQEAELVRERKLLDAQSQRVDSARKTVADQMQELGKARRELNKERHQWQAEQAQAAAEMQTREHDAQEREAALENQRQELDLRAAQVSELEEMRHGFGDLETTLLERSHDLDRREEQLADLESVRQEIVVRETALQNRQEELEQQSHRLQTQEAQQLERDSEQQRQQEELDAERQSVQQQLTELAAQREEIEALQNSLNTEREEVSRLREDLKEQSERLEENQSVALSATELDERAAKLDALRRDIEELELALNSQVQSISDDGAELAQQVRSHQERVANLQAQAQSQTEQFDLRDAELTDRELELQNLEERIQVSAEEFQTQQAEMQSAADETATQLTALADELQSRTEELGQWESELNQRHSETADRVVALKQLAKSTAQTAGADTDAAAQVAAIAQQLADAERFSETVAAERDELQMALEELKVAFESAREQLTEASSDVPRLKELQARLESVQAELLERDESAAEMRKAVTEQEQARLDLEQQLADLTESFEAERTRLESATEAAVVPASDVDEAALLSQIESLQQEVAETQQQLSQRESETVEASDNSEYVAMVEQLTEKVEQQNAIIVELQSAAGAGSATDDGVSAEEIRTLHRELDDRTVVLDGREESLREQQRMLEQSTNDIESQRRQLLEARQQLELARAEIQGANPDAEDPNDRTDTLLALPEQDAVAEYDAEDTSGAVDDVESVISRLMGGGSAPVVDDAPTNEQPTYEAPSYDGNDSEDSYEATPESDSIADAFSAAQDLLTGHASLVSRDDASEADYPADNGAEAGSSDEAPAVRSEIAELFGLGGGTPTSDSGMDDSPHESHSLDEEAEENRPSTAAELMAAVDDYSQENAAAVSMKFEDAEQMLLEAADDADAEPKTEEEHEDFVSSYMEQLLARNRGAAGGSLPEELKKPEPKPAAKKEAAPPKAPGQASFIDQYMSGAFGTPEEGLAAPKSGDVAAESLEPAKPRPPRQKIDLDEMRNNMNSFRELSTKSVENALATHAKRQHRGGIAAQSTVFMVSAMLCVVIVSASLMGVIPFGVITWASIVAAIVTGGALAWKINAVKTEVNEVANQVRPDHEAVNPEAQEAPAPVPAIAPDAPAIAEVPPALPSDVAETPAPVAPLSPEVTELMEAAEKIEEPSYEL